MNSLKILLIFAVFITANDSLTVTLPGGVPLVMIKIPSGNFLMGMGEFDWCTCCWGPTCNMPQHQVGIGYDFYIGKYEVTQEQWQAVMDTNPGRFPISPKNPVNYISWSDCNQFCEKASNRSFYRFRLPSEAEWEYACRAGTATKFFFPDSCVGPYDSTCATLDKYACWRDIVSGTQKVGSYLPNPWGLYDMLGNVYEICQDDWSKSYDGVPADGRPVLGIDSTKKVIRGAWKGDHDVRKFQSSFRSSTAVSGRNSGVGLRVIMSIPTRAQQSRNFGQLEQKRDVITFIYNGNRMIITKGNGIYNLRGEFLKWNSFRSR